MTPASEPPPSYEPPSMTPALGRVIVYALVLTGVILLLIPFTQYITGLVDGKPDLIAINVVPPPPPAPPDIEGPPEPPPPEEPPPEFSEPPPPVSLAQLDVALEAGIGDALSDGFGFGGFSVQPNAVEDILLFDVKDLDEVPRPIRQVSIVAPIRFKQGRINGLVRLEVQIDEEGKTTVLDIVETSHRELVEPAIEAAEQWLWTPPKKNGEPVRARYYFPLGFKF